MISGFDSDIKEMGLVLALLYGRYTFDDEEPTFNQNEESIATVKLLTPNVSEMILNRVLLLSCLF